MWSLAGIKTSPRDLGEIIGSENYNLFKMTCHWESIYDSDPKFTDKFKITVNDRNYDQNDQNHC